MAEFPITFFVYPSGEEERCYNDDWWTWVKNQPQDAVLLWLRSSSWDNVQESTFEELVNSPTTDLAIVAVVYWGDVGKLAEPGYLAQKIIQNLDRGFYKTSEFWLDRNQFMGDCMIFAREMRQADLENLPYKFPRQLLGPFRGRKAEVPFDYGVQVEAQIKEVENHIDYGLPRSEDEYLQSQNKLSFRKETHAEAAARLAVLQQTLPADPVKEFSHLSDFEYLQRFFCSIDAYEHYRGNPNEERLRRGFPLYLSGVFGLGYLGLALILWLIGAFEKSKASQFGAIFSLSVTAVILLVTLAIVWKNIKK